MRFKALHLFCGGGGFALGTQRAGFETVGAFDFDSRAVAAHDYLTGGRATLADLGTMSPAELRAACTGRPDVVFTSPPCKGNSGCLPAAVAATERYQAMNQLAFRGVWIALEAWPERPPAMFVLENVPRIMTRSRALLDDLGKLLRAYGYVVRETTHDCGELGGLAQHRRRFLLVARHMHQIREFLYQPPKRRVRGVGEVLGDLPVPAPGSTEGGPMHRLPKMSTKNWVRLALIPAGGDWRDLPAAVALPGRDARQNGGFGVEGWSAAAHAVIARGGAYNGPWQVADPRLGHEAYRGTDHVCAWPEPSHTIIASTGSKTRMAAAVSDPRVPELVGAPFDWESARPLYLVIRAADGTWHRPMTTLELAALQGLPVWHRDAWLDFGVSQGAAREIIGNMVPPPAAEAIGREVMKTLLAARAGGLLLSGEPVWARARRIPGRLAGGLPRDSGAL